MAQNFMILPNLCPTCGTNQGKLIVKLITNQVIQEANKRDFRLPKYAPMIKLVCVNCGRYIKFVEQTEEVINEINNV